MTDLLRNKTEKGEREAAPKDDPPTTPPQCVDEWYCKEPKKTRRDLTEFVGPPLSVVGSDTYLTAYGGDGHASVLNNACEASGLSNDLCQSWALARGFAFPDTPCTGNLPNQAANCHIRVCQQLGSLCRPLLRHGQIFGRGWLDDDATWERLSRISLASSVRNRVPDRTSLAYRVLYGDLVYWHGMAPSQPSTNRRVQRAILRQARIWYSQALAFAPHYTDESADDVSAKVRSYFGASLYAAEFDDGQAVADTLDNGTFFLDAAMANFGPHYSAALNVTLQGGPTLLSNASLFALGKLAHMIAVSYSPQHTLRNKMGEIVLFQTRQCQRQSDPHLHVMHRRTNSSINASDHVNLSYVAAHEAVAKIFALYGRGASIDEVVWHLVQGPFALALGEEERATGVGAHVPCCAVAGFAADGARACERQPPFAPVMGAADQERQQLPMAHTYEVQARRRRTLGDSGSAADGLGSALAAASSALAHEVCMSNTSLGVIVCGVDADRHVPFLQGAVWPAMPCSWTVTDETLPVYCGVPRQNVHLQHWHAMANVPRGGDIFCAPGIKGGSALVVGFNPSTMSTSRQSSGSAANDTHFFNMGVHSSHHVDDSERFRLSVLLPTGLLAPERAAADAMLLDDTSATGSSDNRNIIIRNRILLQLQTWYAAAIAYLGDTSAGEDAADSARAGAFFPIGKMLHLVRVSYLRGHVLRDQHGLVLAFRSRHCTPDGILFELHESDTKTTSAAWQSALLAARTLLGRFERIYATSQSDKSGWRLGYRQVVADELYWLGTFVNDTLLPIAADADASVSGLYPDCDASVDIASARPRVFPTPGAIEVAPSLDVALCSAVRAGAQNVAISAYDGANMTERQAAAVEPSLLALLAGRHRCAFISRILDAGDAGAGGIIDLYLAHRAPVAVNQSLVPVSLSTTPAGRIVAYTRAFSATRARTLAHLLGQAHGSAAVAAEVSAFVDNFAVFTSDWMVYRAWLVSGQPVFASHIHCLRRALAYFVKSMAEVEVQVEASGVLAEEVLRCQVAKALGCGGAGPTCWSGPQLTGVCIGSSASSFLDAQINAGLVAEAMHGNKAIATLAQRDVDATLATNLQAYPAMLRTQAVCPARCHRDTYLQAPTTSAQPAKTLLTCLPNALATLTGVLDVQRYLKCNGFYWGAVDGVAGPATDAALRGFQDVTGIPGHGRLDTETRRAMRAYSSRHLDAPRVTMHGAVPTHVTFICSPATVGPAAPLTTVAEVQVWLKCHGFMAAGAVDGQRGLHTARAIRNFQRASNMLGDGTITKALRQAMQEWSRRGGQAILTKAAGIDDINFACPPNGNINVDEVVGAKTFLRCNGFSYGGTMNEVSSIDPPFRAAVAAFQAVVGIPANGIVSLDTAAAMHAWEGTWAHLRPDGSRPEPRSTAWQVDGLWTRHGDTEAAGDTTASASLVSAVSPETTSLNVAHQLVEDGTTITDSAGAFIVPKDSPIRSTVPAIVSALQNVLSAPYCQDFSRLKTAQLRNLASRRGLDTRGGRQSLADVLAFDAQDNTEGRCPALASSANNVACCVREEGCLGLRCYIPIDGLTATQSASGGWATVRLAAAGGRVCDTEFSSSPVGDPSTAGLTPDGVILETRMDLDTATTVFASTTIRDALLGDSNARRSLSLLLRLSATPSDDAAALPIRSLRVRLAPRGAKALVAAGFLGSVLADVTLHACYDEGGLQCEPGMLIFREAPLAFPDNCASADASRYRREDARGAASGGLAVKDIERLTLGEVEVMLRAFGLDGLLSQLRDVVLVVDRLQRQDGTVDAGVAFSSDGFDDESLESFEFCLGGVREFPIRSKTFFKMEWIVPLGGFIFFKFSASIAGEVGIVIKSSLCIPTLTVTGAAGPYFSVYAVRRGPC